MSECVLSCSRLATYVRQTEGISLFALQVKTREFVTAYTVSECREFAESWEADPLRFLMWIMHLPSLLLWTEKRNDFESLNDYNNRRLRAAALTKFIHADPERATTVKLTRFRKDMLELEQSGFNVTNDANFGSEEHTRLLGELSKRVANPSKIWEERYPRAVVEEHLKLYDWRAETASLSASYLESSTANWTERVLVAAEKHLPAVPSDALPLVGSEFPDNVQCRLDSASAVQREQFLEEVYVEKRYKRNSAGKKRNPEIVRQRAAHYWRHNAVYRYCLQKADAKRRDRGQPWTLTKDFAIDLMSKPCFYCGGFSDDCTVNSLDRLCSAGTYSDDNVVPACYMCNWMKRTLSVHNFLEMVGNIAAHARGLPLEHNNLQDNTAQKPTYLRYQQDAQQRGIEFKLGEKEFEELILHNCQYCGKSSGGLNWNGIDRVDNTGVYESTNCVSCCWPCNRMKWQWPLDVFLERCAAISDRKEEILEVI